MESKLKVTSPVNTETTIVEDAYKIIRKWKLLFTGHLGFGSSVIAVVGNSGKGKTSLVQFLANGVNNPNLFAIEDPPKSGHFAIRDKAGKIGVTHRTAGNMYPEIVASSAKKVIFYDCLSFDKISGPVQSMASAYFNKIVLDKFDLITFVICVDFETASGVQGAKTFLNEIKATATFFSFNGLLPYRNSFLLVVTKVPAHKEFDSEIVPHDEEVIHTVGNTIEAAHQLLEHDFLSNMTDEVARIRNNTAFILRDLILQENGTFPRIKLFRLPQTSGALAKSSYMEGNRQQILNAIRNDTIPGVAGPFYVHIALSTEILQHIEKVAKTLDETINHLLMDLENKIMDTVLARMDRSGDWTKTQSDLGALRDVLIDFAQKELKYDQKLTHEFISNLSQVLKNSNLGGFSEIIERLGGQVTYMRFLELLTMKHFAKIPVDVLEPCVNLLTQSISWYSTLYQVLEELSKYDYQQKPEKYNMRELNDWGGYGPPGLQISQENVHQFFELLGIHETGNFALNAGRCNELNTVVHMTLAEKPKIFVTPEGMLLATGQFVRISELLEMYEQEKERIQAVILFASGTIFIDTDFTAPGRHMLLAAPKLHVTQPVIMNLDGRNGEDRIGTAAEGRGESPGESGGPGGDGQHAGHFLATAMDSDNLGFLTISTNGGNGGRGQDGGRGGNGSNGWDPELPSNRHDSKPIGKKDVDWVLLEHKVDKGGASGYYVVTHDYTYKLIGKKATDGQLGGDGGAGGRAGSKGEIRFAVLGETHSGGGVPVRRERKGEAGVDGKGGRGGDKAKHGLDWKVRYSVTLQGSIDDGRWEHLSTFNNENEYSKVGPNGRNGRTKKAGSKKEIEQVPLGLLATFLNRFKAYSLRIASACPVRRSSLESFLGRIADSLSIFDIYDISSYLNEMSILESEFWALNQLLDLKPYYASILKRITNFPGNKPVSVGENEDKLVLSTIYAACLSKICSLGVDHTKEHRLIVHLKSFMETTIGRIEELETMDKGLSIKQFQKSYRSGIESKITEAKDLITGKVNPAIESLLRGLDTKLDELVKETIKRRQKAVTDRDKLIADEKQMQTAMLIKGALNILKLGAMVASFAGPMGTAIGDVVTNGSTIAEQFVIEADVKNNNKISVPKGVTDAIKGLGDLLNVVRAKKFESVEEQLKMVDKELAKKPKDLEKLEKTIEEIREKFKVEKNKKIEENDLEGAAAQKEKLEDIDKELKEALEDKKFSLEAEIKKGAKEKKEVLEIVDKINKGIKLISGFMDIYNTYKGDQDKLEVIRNSLTDADTNIFDLKNYERDIHATMFPLVRNMRDNVNAVTASLSSKSQVALDVSKWETQKMLSEIQKKLTEALKGYKAQEGVTSCFNKLTEALNLLVNIYDRLEHFQDQQRLGDYIANIGAPMDYSNVLAGTPFENEFGSLHLTMQSNFVLLEFETGMHAFRQWIFPFGKFYYEKYSLPKNLRPVRDSESLHALVVAASKQLRVARNSIVGYNNSITHRDHFFYVGTFTSEVKIGAPFFTWPYVNYKDELDSLFNGEAITLLADIENVPHEIKYRKAIKFQNVWLNFRLTGSGISAKTKAKFQALLDYFFVDMVHGGTSFYDFHDEYFVIQGNPINLGYSFQKNGKGEPLTQSEQRGKLNSSGELLLSPYAQWKLKLSIGNENNWDEAKTIENNDVRDPFERIQDFMKNYGPYLVLELVGTGTYIYDKENRLANELCVNDYYQIYGKK